MVVLKKTSKYGKKAKRSRKVRSPKVLGKKIKRVKKAKKIKERVKKITKKISKSAKRVKRVIKNPLKKKRRLIKRVLKRPLVKRKPKPLDLRRSEKNPILSPTSIHWESEAVFNPGAVVSGDRVHLFYRALGSDGLSRIGYASSDDGIHFNRRYSYPVYMPETGVDDNKRYPNTSPARLVYDRTLHASGGGWGGCEDPRAIKIERRVYMTFNVFDGWYNIRVGMTSIDEGDIENDRWNWRSLTYLSPPNQRHKNWVIFPEKIGGKYALLHNLHHDDPNQVCIEYIDDIEKVNQPFKSHDPHLVPDRHIAWHNRMRSVGPPPVKTPYGWLLFYHAMDRSDPNRYKLGVMLLDHNNPRKILYRSKYPVLEPDEWYENDWKPGIIYASGAVVKGDTLFLYYGGGDKYVGVAHAKLSDFIRKLMKNEHIVFSKKISKVK
jgi:beta-1,2-mannobiose phosphorylase / 1,2-beta-oligomannan phosphorylase